MDHSVSEVEKFLDYLATKGLMPKPTVVSRKAACNKMFSILDESESSDVRKLNIDELASRFANLEGSKYTPDSLKTYKSRVSKTIDDFIRYNLDPIGFKGVSSTIRKKRETTAPQAPTAPPSGTTPASQAPPSAPHQHSSTHRSPMAHQPSLRLPIPIREGIVVEIEGLPFDLKEAEAQKIANVILAMASP